MINGMLDGVLASKCNAGFIEEHIYQKYGRIVMRCAWAKHWSRYKMTFAEYSNNFTPRKRLYFDKKKSTEFFYLRVRLAKIDPWF